MSEWKPDGWWRVLRDGELWCETSSESEARESADRPGDVLQRHEQRVDQRWVTA